MLPTHCLNHCGTNINNNTWNVIQKVIFPSESLQKLNMLLSNSENFSYLKLWYFDHKNPNVIIFFGWIDLGCFCTGVLGCYPRSEGQRLLPSFRLRLCFSPSSSPCGSEGLAYGAWDVIPADALEPDLSSRPWRRAHMRYSEPTMATTYACHFPSGAVAEMMRWCTVEAQSALKTMAFGHKDPWGLRCNFLFPRVLSTNVHGQLCWMVPGEGCVYDVCALYVWMRCVVLLKK